MSIAGARTEAGRVRFEQAYAAALVELPTPSHTLDIDTSFGTVRAYRWQGDDAMLPVLLLPGQIAGAPMWGENLPGFLATGRTLIAIDALGDAGMSQQRVPLRSLDDQAQWIDEVLTAVNVTAIHTLGHSFGGASAANHAVRHPERVASLTLLEPVFTLRWPPISVFFWATIAVLPVPGAWRDRALAAIGGVSLEQLREESAIGTLIAVASETFRTALPTPRPLTDEQLTALGMPVYLAVAGTSSLAGSAAAERARSQLPDAVVEVWSGATHSLPMQFHEALGTRLAEFWNDVDRRRAAAG